MLKCRGTYHDNCEFDSHSGDGIISFSRSGNKIWRGIGFRYSSHNVAKIEWSSNLQSAPIIKLILFQQNLKKYKHLNRDLITGNNI